MVNNMKGFVKLSEKQFETLSKDGTLVVGDTTYTYEPETTIYITPDNGSGGNTYNENLLFNQEFKINQKGITKYAGSNNSVQTQYTCDRWYKDKLIEAGYDSSNNFYIKNTQATPYYFGQFIYSHIKLLGNKATFWLSTSTQDYTFTFNTIPEDTSTITQNTVIESFDTDFGGVQLEWRKTHFIINIKLNPSTTLTLKGAKLEVGDKFTGFVKKEESDELMECMRFLQAPFSQHHWRVGQRSITQTEESLLVILDFYPMISNPKMLRYDTKMRYRKQDGTTTDWITPNGYGDGVWQGGRTKTVIFSKVGNFSEELGESTSLTYVTSIGLQGAFFEAEITD